MSKENFADDFFRTLVDDLNEINEVRNKVITLHLYVELLMNIFIDSFFVNGELITNSRSFSFYKKIIIIEALGFDKQLCQNIKMINEYRNKFAHNLNLSSINLGFSKVYVKDPEEFSRLNDINKIQILAVESLIRMNEQFHKFLKWRKEIFEKSS